MDVNQALFGWKTGAIALGLFIFSYFYNRWVASLQKKTDSYTAEMVVIGVAVTVLSSMLVIGFLEGMVVLLLFGFSGFWMLIGSWQRHAADTEDARSVAREQLRHDD